jgi:hypothetical protein
VALRRSTDIWEELFEALRWLFTLIHPAWSIPIAALSFIVPVFWIRHSVHIPQVQTLAYVIGAIPAMINLGAGLAGWRCRQERTAFLRQHLDIDWLNNLS